MDKVPALTEDGQNWKIYRMKLLEHAATKGWLGVLAGASDNGTNDWEGCNALLHELLHDTIHISIYIQLHHNTAHQVFKYLAKRFRDREPIADPRAKKLVTCTNEVKHDPSAETPTSENAATGAEREDPPTKDLTRGTEDVDNRNVGRTQDPCTSSEASAEGNSAECANGTLVLLTGELHKTQNVPQNSLPLTPRLPIDGKPDECKQEAAESIVTAGRTNGMVRMTEPHETVADINGKAAPGRELVERVHVVNEGTETEHDSKSQLQQNPLLFFPRRELVKGAHGCTSVALEHMHYTLVHGDPPKTSGPLIPFLWLFCLGSIPLLIPDLPHCCPINLPDGTQPPIKLPGLCINDSLLLCSDSSLAY